jgi:cell division transport system permease protein
VILRSKAVERIAERSAVQALESFRIQLGPDADVLNGLGLSILPFSYRVILRSGWRTVANIESLTAQVRVMAGVERLRNDLVWLRRLDGVIHLLRLAVWTVSVLLGLGVLFIIANTIRMTLYARRDDIAVMHIVGATDGFIRTPFMTEGVLCGLFGGVFAYLVLLLVYHAFFLPMLSTYTDGSLLVQPVGWPLGLLLVGTGAGLGLAGSAITVSHYLRRQRE